MTEPTLVPLATAMAEQEKELTVDQRANKLKIEMLEAEISNVMPDDYETISGRHHWLITECLKDAEAKAEACGYSKGIEAAIKAVTKYKKEIESNDPGRAARTLMNNLGPERCSMIFTEKEIIDSVRSVLKTELDMDALIRRIQLLDTVLSTTEIDELSKEFNLTEEDVVALYRSHRS